MDIIVKFAGANKLLEWYASIVAIVKEDNRWTRLTVSYFLSGRTDFLLGTFEVVPQLGQSAYFSSLANWVPLNGSAMVVVEISGLRVQSAQFTATLTSVAVNTTNGLLNLTANFQSSPLLTLVQISYIIWPNTSLIGSTNYDPSLPFHSFSFVGMDSVVNGYPVFAGNGFGSDLGKTGVTCLSQTCSLKCISTQQCQAEGKTLNAAASTCQ
jgi:hypothetical protein